MLNGGIEMSECEICSLVLGVYIILLIVIPANYFIARYKCIRCKNRSWSWSGGAVDGCKVLDCGRKENYYTWYDYEDERYYENRRHSIAVLNFFGTCKYFDHRGKKEDV
jgi:hypothetical protein